MPSNKLVPQGWGRKLTKPAVQGGNFPKGNRNVYSTPGSTSFVVPSGVTSIGVKLWGAGGGSTGSNKGGAGAFLQTILTVTPGETLTVITGGSSATNTPSFFGGGGAGGSSGANVGAAGGGYSGIKRSSTLLACAAGGGGSSSASVRSGGGAENAGSKSGSDRAALPGNAEYGGLGADGAYSGSAGSSEQGGAGSNGSSSRSGGGGGGGYFGGGGGQGGDASAVGSAQTGGAGGSSYPTRPSTAGDTYIHIAPIGVSETAVATADSDYISGVGAGGAASAGGDGLVVITY